ncbi:MAG: tripartite tricarboxylate transporter substrate binding protein [Betaproteobacteria bacterium]|nr:tripartite tricarboxylate transporter substrate binding protein [Betaproteobacteria bacterium]
MKSLIRSMVCAILMPLSLTPVSAAAQTAADAAQAYPQRPIRWIVPAPPGGGTDAVSRIMAPRLTELWKQQIVVDNRGGAQGSIATAMAAKSAPDGYTILFTFSGPMAVNPHVFREVGYDALKDFAGLTRYTQQPMVMSAHPTVPAASFKELAALAKASPGKFTFASSASLQHLGGELFNLAAGVKLTHVPYKGAGPAVLDLLGGNVSTMISNPTAVVPHIRTGKLKALGILGGQRIEVLKEVPTAVEQGFKEFADVIEWYGMVAPAATPRPIVRRLNEGLVRVLNMPDVQERIRALGMTPAPSTTEELEALIRADHALWGGVVKRAGVKSE